MTREEMNKRHFKPYMKLIIETHYGQKECILVCANFDTESFLVRLFPDDDIYEQDIWVSISTISLPKRKMELIQSK